MSMRVRVCIREISFGMIVGLSINLCLCVFVIPMRDAEKRWVPNETECIYMRQLMSAMPPQGTLSVREPADERAGGRLQRLEQLAVSVSPYYVCARWRWKLRVFAHIYVFTDAYLYVCKYSYLYVCACIWVRVPAHSLQDQVTISVFLFCVCLSVVLTRDMERRWVQK